MAAFRPIWWWVVVAVLVTGGCSVELTDQGWFTPPAQTLIISTPADFGLSYEAIEFAAPSGHTIHGWFIPADDASASVLINHGAVFNRSMLSSQYSILHDLGCNVLVYDYEGFGESDGVASLDKLVPDADAALEYLQSRPEPGTDQVILFGISMGTLPTLAQAARAPDGVVAVVLDGSFVPESLPPWSLPLLGLIPLPEVTDRFAVEYGELDPYQYIEHITLPKLFIQSPTDVIAPFFGAERLYELAPEPKQLVEVTGGHILPSVLDQRYAECLESFLAEAVNRGE